MNKIKVSDHIDAMMAQVNLAKKYGKNDGGITSDNEIMNDDVKLNAVKLTLMDIMDNNLDGRVAYEHDDSSIRLLAGKAVNVVKDKATIVIGNQHDSSEELITIHFDNRSPLGFNFVSISSLRYPITLIVVNYKNKPSDIMADIINLCENILDKIKGMQQ